MAKTKTTLMRLAGRSLARLISYIKKTSPLTLDPPDLHQRLGAQHPVILAMWHGQFMLLPLLQQNVVTVKAMVARHGDAELIGEALRQFDIELIRGAGAGDRKRDRGGATALREALRALAGGATVAMTADIPPGPARVSGTGIVTLARMSGRPIVAVAAASSRFKAFDTWSRMTLNLPYSKLALVLGDPIFVARDADADALEEARSSVERELNRVTARAYEITGADLANATPLELLPADPAGKPGLALNAYRTLLTAARPAAPMLLSMRARQGKEDPTRSGERIGKPGIARPAGPLVWVHAASVGETNAALPLIDEILAGHRNFHVLLTTGTTTSAALAAARLGERAIHQFVPLDVPAYGRRFLDHWQPNLAIFTESDVWPNLILETARRSVPLALINARMSPRSIKRWRRFARRARPVFARFDLALAQNDKIARTLRALGVQTVTTAGNLKIDAPALPVNQSAFVQLKIALGGRPSFVAASTHPGEEQIIAQAHQKLAQTIPGLITIIVPRHPERGGQIEIDLQTSGLAITRRSQHPLPTAATQIFIADTLGELGTFYALTPVAFIGGSLIPRGGQNPIEAIRHGAAVVTGPSYHNFVDAYAALLAANGAREASSATELAVAIGALLTDTAAAGRQRDNATAALAGMSGAMAKTLAALEPYLSKLEHTSHAAQ